MLFYSLIYLAVFVVEIVAFWKVFEKAGQPGWACIVPIYNLIVMLKIAGKPLWWIIMFIIPGVNVVFLVWMTNMISKSFGKDEGFTVGLVLLGFIFYPILGFGDARYLGPYGDPAAFQAAQNPSFDFDKGPQPA
jgi:hypothetical protein